MNKAKFRKAFLRDVEIPLSKTNAKVIKPVLENTAAPNKTTSTKNSRRLNDLPKTTVSGKFKQPELHTALNVCKQIEKIKTTNSAAPTSIGELTPKSKKFVREEITKRLNFQHDENVFKGLKPVNVNDSVLIPVTKKPLRTKYVSKEKRDPEPELADFLRPIPEFNLNFDPYLPTEVTLAKPNGNNFRNIINVFNKIDFGA
ncbi:protein PPP1R35 homolog [Wyeomyia smithii]|uniref:protein PPP1R35 homolog n=1 Tax=Wyeomyia smithii TaxID=174621 RepID=UPI0024680176|nr:protein PPP1R35 homolog [Wyeomyia smithii]